MSYGKITILLTGSLRSPPLSGLRRTSPRESVSHDSQVALLPYESCSLATPVQGSEQPMLKVESLQKIASRSFIVPPAAGGIGIYMMAPKAPYLPSGTVLHTSRGRSPQPVREASAGPGQNPGSPGPKGPAAGSTLTPVRACQPSGIPESTAPVPIPTAPKGTVNPQARQGLSLRRPFTIPLIPIILNK